MGTVGRRRQGALFYGIATMRAEFQDLKESLLSFSSWVSGTPQNKRAGDNPPDHEQSPLSTFFIVH